jgi:NADPH:quinone reductase-like Zn-dependent oxidoreductase
MKAIKVVNLCHAEIQEVAKPSIYPDYVLVKVKAVALNPADWKSLDSLSTPGKWDTSRIIANLTRSP